MNAGTPLEQPARDGGLLSRVTGGIALLGGLLSLAAAFLVVTSVALRWLGIGSVPGDFEMVQALVAVSVFCFLPFAQWRRANIMVGAFTARLTARARNLIDALWSLVYAGMAGLLAYSLLLGTRDAFASGLGTMVLQWPLGPVFAVSTALLAVLCVTALASAALLFGRRS